jgi:calcium/calmodulin-dependent 3',5'-cyclic nucleotide phosphodiesterase
MVTLTYSVLITPNFTEITDGHALKYVGFELFNRYGFLERFKINCQTLENYLLALEVGYNSRSNPYHNSGLCLKN